MKRVDREALQRALALGRAENPKRREQLDWIKKTSGWEESACSAAFGLQLDRLRLRPWQAPPCVADVEVSPSGNYGGMVEEVTLLRRLLAAKISRYEPDPLGALERAAATPRSADDDTPRDREHDTKP